MYEMLKIYFSYPFVRYAMLVGVLGYVIGNYAGTLVGILLGV